MGRKQHPLVSEYFIRGEKLSDSSNRYAHSCRRCGEYFAKGRVDSLCSHLLRKCPGLGEDERNFVFQAIQQSNDQVSRIIRSKPNGVSAPRADDPQPPQNVIDEDIDSSFPVLGQQSALDTLAEVSRRHLDYKIHHHHGSPHQNASPDQPYHELDHAQSLQDSGSIAEQLRYAADTLHAQPTPIELTRVLYEVPGSKTEQPLDPSRPPTPYVPPESEVERPSVQADHVAEQDFEQQIIIEPEPKVPEAQVALNPSFDSPNAELPTQAAATAAAADLTQPVDEIDMMSWNPMVNLNPQKFPDLTGEPTNSSFGILRQGGKNRVRGRFEDTRRKEVQNIRKQGACMRCRMLKKPCSEGTPCKTCKEVESARLWKGKCLRTRLIDEFRLWNTGLFHSKAKIEVPGAVYGLEQHPLNGRIEVRLFDSDLATTFKARKYNKNLVRYRSDLIEPEAHGAPDVPPDIWLLDEGDDMPSKIELYANKTVDACIANEECPFLRTTLERAQEMVKSQPAETEATNNNKTTRSSYNLRNQLLRDVVELWVQTVILSSCKQTNMKLRYNPQHAAEQLPLPSSWPAHNGSTRQHQCLPEPSEKLILAQLLAATEARCLGLSKNIINEMERRLLQRQQASKFSTLLCAVILLNCVERMTGAFRAFDTEERPPNWPLDKPPSAFWSQGEKFADLLITLLRMRALPPKTSIDNEGKLIVTPNSAPVIFINGEEQVDEDAVLTTEWLEGMGLKEVDLLRIREGGLPRPEDPIEDWDLKFVVRLLLPLPRK